MLTFFTTAKPFRGHDGIIQRNALQSWKLLHSDVEVILFGDGEGSVEVAQELQIRHELHVTRNEYGAKRLDTMFFQAQAIARHDLLCYINCDIILMRDFCGAIRRIQAAHSQFLTVGRRQDTQVDESLDFKDQDWEARLRKRVLREGRRRGPEWIDYFVFRRGLYGADVPPLVIGRVFWDNWLVWKALDSKYPVVDASADVLAVHQNHDYSYHPQGKNGVFHGQEAARNHELAGGWKHLRTIADASEALRDGSLQPNRLRHWARAKRYARQGGRVLLHGGIEHVWFFFLGLTRPVRQRLGLRSDHLRRLHGKALTIFGKHS